MRIYDYVERQGLSLARRFVPYVVLALMLSVSVWLWRVRASEEETRARARFDEYCKRISQDITDELDDYRRLLRSAAGLFVVSEEVTRDDWQAYFEYRQALTRYPGMQGLGFGKVVAPAELAQHVARIRAEGLPEYSVRPDGERTIYTPVIFLEPFDAIHQAVLGYDMFSEPVRRVAMERARDTASPAMTGRLRLVIEDAYEEKQDGYIIYIPVFTSGVPPEDLEARRAALTGYVYGILRVKDLMRSIFPDGSRNVAFELYDGATVAPEAFLFECRTLPSGTERRARFSSHARLDLYGHTWSLAFRPTPKFDAEKMPYLPWIILAAGLTFSILVFLLIRSQQDTVKKAKALAAELTADLRKSEQRFEQITRHSRAFVWEINAEGRYTYASAAVEDLLGYRPEELIGRKTVYDLHPEEGLEAFTTAAAEIIANKNPFSNLENPVQTKSGAVIWVNSSGIPLLDSEGNLIGHRGSDTDITERKRMERFEQQRSAILTSMVTGTQSLDETLLLIVKLIEDQNPDALASVLLLDDRGERLLLGAAPSLPDFYNQAIHGLRIGDGVGSCGTAAYTAERVVVEDILTHPYWTDFRDLARRANLRSCWSQPIYSRDSRVLGTFAIYKRIPGHPSHEEIVQIEAASALVSLALRQEQTQLDRIARQTAEQANQAKSAFLANMSHEIRTPLNAVLGFAQILERDASLTPRQTGMLRTIARSGQHLLNLINDILDMSKIESGRLELRPTDFSLHALLDDVEMMFRSRAQAKQLQLLMERDDSVPRYVNTDEGKLRQVLINLLGNAVKFTQTGGVAVRVRCETVTDGSNAEANALRLVVEVEDSGPGIAAEEQDRIFEPFRQSGTARDAGGTGLGLAVSRRIVDLMGGSLTVKSQVGKGSSFRFDVLVTLAEGAAQEIAPAMRQVVGLEPGTGPFRILIVDDQRDNRDLLAALLEPLDVEIREAVNGQEAIDVFEAWSPHAVLMDMRMPVLDGYEATRHIKATEKGRATPVIAVTASAFDDAEKEVLAAGVDGYVRKPFREEEIFAVLEKCLGLQYVYAEDAGQAQEKTLLQPLTLADSAALPEALKQAMRQAIDEGDMAGLQACITQLEVTDTGVAHKLRSLADQYDYDTLTQILGEQG